MDGENNKTLIDKGFVEVYGVGGNLFYVLDLLAHLLDKHFKFYA